jgi:hypothetical protein
MAASALKFEAGRTQVHEVLAVRADRAEAAFLSARRSEGADEFCRGYGFFPDTSKHSIVGHAS